MKAGIACMLLAMSALRRSGCRLAGDLCFAGVADEEQRSLGASALLRSGFRAEGAILGEPTDLIVCPGHRGLEWLELRFIGKTVHGGKQEEGINAVSAAARFIGLLDSELAPLLASRIHPLLGNSSVNVGRIEGGSQPSTVAGECILQLDRRWIPGEQYEDVLTELNALGQRVGAETPGLGFEMTVMDVSVMNNGMVHAPLCTASDHPLVTASVSALSAIGWPSAERLGVFPAWSDGGLLAAYGKIPAIVWGPGSLESAHSEDERVEIAQLLPAAQAYALAALEFCQ